MLQGLTPLDDRSILDTESSEKPRLETINRKQEITKAYCGHAVGEALLSKEFA